MTRWHSEKAEFQKGPNTQLGGLSAGFTSVEYQFGIAETVNTDPIIPASSDTPIATANLDKLLSFIIPFYQKAPFFAMLNAHPVMLALLADFRAFDWIKEYKYPTVMLDQMKSLLAKYENI